MDLKKLIKFLEDGKSDEYIIEYFDTTQEKLDEAKKLLGKVDSSLVEEKDKTNKDEDEDEDEDEDDMEEENEDEDEDEDDIEEAKMEDSEVLSVAKKLVDNSEDAKIKKFAQGLIDFHKKEGSFTPDQVSGLQNIMKNASFNLAKKESFDIRKNRLSVDVTKDVDALFSEETDFSEEFKAKAKDIIQAAISSKISKEIDRIEEEVEQELKERLEEEKEKIVEDIDGYINYITENWMEENQLAVETGIKTKLTENFIQGLKELFTEHYIEIPEDKTDVLEEVAREAKEMEDKLNLQIENNLNLKKELGGYKKVYILSSLSEDADLTDVQKDELCDLVEDYEYISEKNYKSKVANVIKSYFKKEVDLEEDESREISSGTNNQLDENKSSYQERIASMIGDY